MQSLQPASTLPTYIIEQPRNDFELIKACERRDILRKLYGYLEIIDCDNNFADALQLLLAIVPGTKHGARNGCRLVAKV